MNKICKFRLMKVRRFMQSFKLDVTVIISNWFYLPQNSAQHQSKAPGMPRNA